MNDPMADDPAAGIRVHVTDLKSSADALYFEDENGQPVLLIRRKQSFPSAVEGVQDAMEISEEQARAIVRFHHPEAAAWGEQNASELIAAPSVGPLRPARPQQPPAEPEQKPTRHLRLLPRWTVTAIAAVAALGAGYQMAGQQGPPHTSPGPAGGIELADAEPYTSAAFKDFAADGEMACTPTGPLEAKCVDVDGKVMYSEASIGSDWTQFSFTYDEGDKRIHLRVFSNEAAAKLWAREDGIRESVRNLVQYGRYALWGNDTARLNEYLKLLKDQDEPSAALETRANGRHAGNAEHVTAAATELARPGFHRSKHAKDPAASQPHRTVTGRGHQRVHPAETTVHIDSVQAAPMPRRLAVLALGTLGIDPANPPTLGNATTLQEMGTLVAISIVMGVDPADTGLPVHEIPELGQGATTVVITEPTTGNAEMPDVTVPWAPTVDRQKPVDEKPPAAPAPSQPVEPTTPTAPATPPQPAPTLPVAPPTAPPPVTDQPEPQAPPADPDPVELEPTAPDKESVLEDPPIDPEQPVGEDQDHGVGEEQVDDETPVEDDSAPTPVEDADAGAELLTIPAAWRGDQATQL
ncbi:hypothetical protein ABT033_31515 [Streptomyces pharetrae]|uniref:hypothetical protein n=1 Tax=Streptomyces pharetrae TaxID=291370 RepID=UPI00335C042F